MSKKSERKPEERVEVVLAMLRREETAARAGAAVPGQRGDDLSLAGPVRGGGDRGRGQGGKRWRSGVCTTDRAVGARGGQARPDHWRAIAEGGRSGVSAQGAGRRVRPHRDRYYTISYAVLESRSRHLIKPDGWPVPRLCIRARWLVLCGFGIGQRVHIAAEPGRLVITPVAPTEPAGAG